MKAIRRVLLVIAAACLVLAGVGAMVAILPVRWVGHPWIDLTRALNPGIDAPGNLFVTFTYFVRTTSTLGSVGCVALTVACWLPSDRKPASIERSE